MKYPRAVSLTVDSSRALLFKRGEHASRRDPKSHDRGGGLLINLLAIPIDRKSPGYKEKQTFPPGGTETLDSFPQARKANAAAVAAMHQSVASRVAVDLLCRKTRRRGGLYIRNERNDGTRRRFVLPVCFLNGIYVNPFARLPVYRESIRGRIFLAFGFRTGNPED